MSTPPSGNDAGSGVGVGAGVAVAAAVGEAAGPVVGEPGLTFEDWSPQAARAAASTRVAISADRLESKRPEAIRAPSVPHARLGVARQGPTAQPGVAVQHVAIEQ